MFSITALVIFGINKIKGDGKMREKELIHKAVCIFIIGLFGLTFSGITPFAHSAEKPIKLVFSQFEMKGGYWNREFCKEWFAELMKRTKGRIEIEQHWSSELYGLFDTYDAILKGVVDMGMILPSMFGDKFPMDSVLIFPAVNIKCHRPAQVWYELYRKFPEFQEQYKKTPLIALTPAPSNVIATNRKVQIRKVEDMKGLKMPGAGPAAETRQKSVGIVPVSVAPSDAYMAFKTGTLDGVASTIYSLADFKWLDVLPNLTIAQINGSPWSFVMSRKAWNRLPKDIQNVFKDMIPWLAELSDRKHALNTRRAIETYPKEYGANLIELSQEELDKWAELDNKNLDDYAEKLNRMGLPGTEVKKEFIRLQKKYSAPQYAF